MRRRGVRLMLGSAATRVRVYLIALWKLARHPRAPRLAKIVAFAVVAYAASPIDLIPDFIPVLGQLDDLVIVPLGIALVVRLTPAPLWQEVLQAAEASAQRLPRLRWVGAVVVLIWLLAAALLVWWLARWWASA